MTKKGCCTHKAATDEEVESYTRGIRTGVMLSATPNVVGSLLKRIELMRADLDDLKRQHKDCLEQKEALRERCETLELGYRGFP